MCVSVGICEIKYFYFHTRTIFYLVLISTKPKQKLALKQVMFKLSIQYYELQWTKYNNMLVGLSLV